jgi:diadenosine tetraphosphate (Ap4A) HIT family hydrolase
MARIIFETQGGNIVCPSQVLCDRRDGGHLIVNPRRAVWDRSALTTGELLAWSVLVAATGEAMLEVLPALQGGCLNYWEAGNWALHDHAAPEGPKRPAEHRRVHLHIFGRSRDAQHPDWRWGASPRFPSFAESDRWSAQFSPLTEEECSRVAARAAALLATRYRLPALRLNVSRDACASAAHAGICA